MILGILMFPLSEHCFVLNVIKQLFLARTQDQKLLVDIEAKDNKGEKMRKSITIHNSDEVIPDFLKDQLLMNRVI